MRSYKLDEITAGMSFTAPVYIDGENILVPEHVEIRDKDIERLRRWGIHEVQSEGEIKREEEAENARQEPNDAALMRASDEYIRGIQLIDEVFFTLQEGGKPDKHSIEKVVNDLYQLLMERPDEVLGPMFQPRPSKHYLSQGAVNCLILSVFMGRKLRIPNHQLAGLAVSALLHDTGMMRVPKDLLEKKGKLSDKELKAIQTHPIYSFRIITRELGYAEELGTTALYHHERWDGKGYPKQLKGKEIPLTSRILSVVDAYEAMVSERPHRNSMIGYRAMRQILNDNSRRFDSEILKIFIKSMGIYPVGSYVVLNDGSVGRVVENHREIPLRPVIRILVGPTGRRIEEKNRRTIDLSQEASLFIVKAVSSNELKEVG
jgi:HD-GYP domain-containing protein (c-di-GMP phosphodiesterase class II)